MADPKKNPLIGAFRAPALGSAPPATAEDTPKATTPVQATAPKTMELPKGAPPKSQTNDVAPATPIEGKKPQKPPKAEDLKGKAEGAATTTPAEGKKSEEPPKATDPKGKAEGAAPAGPTEGKKPEEPPKATDPKGKAEGAAPAGPTEGKKPEEPPKTTDSKGKAEKAAPSTPTETKKPEKPTRTPTPKVEIVSATAQKVAASTQDEIPSDFSLTIVPNDKLGTVAMMPIDLIDDFEGHPFAVRDDADMKELVASIKQVGLLEPATVIRNERKIGRFEMVAGHRRKHAAKLAGLTHIPVIVRDMDHDEATIYMVDSNLKREKLTPMEKARAYTMKTEALRRKMGRRSKEELAALEAEGKKPMTADQELAAQTGESVATVQRFKTLTKLTPPMQQMVDKVVEVYMKKIHRIISFALGTALILSVSAAAVELSEIVTFRRTGSLDCDFGPNTGRFSAAFYDESATTYLYFEYSDSDAEAIADYNKNGSATYGEAYAGVGVTNVPSTSLGDDMMSAYSVTTSLPDPKSEVENDDPFGSRNEESEAVALGEIEGGVEYEMIVSWRDYRSGDPDDKGEWRANAELSGQRFGGDYNVEDYDSLASLEYGDTQGRN